MPFFKPAKYFKELDCVSLQVHKPKKYKKNIYNCGKRVCLFTSRGSITLESSIVLTFFMMAILFVESFLVVINTETDIQMSINNIAKSIAKDKFYLELSDEITNYDLNILEIKKKLENCIEQLEEDKNITKKFEQTINLSYLMAELIGSEKRGEFIDSSIVGGISGINVFESSIENGVVDIVLKYKLKIPFINKFFSVTQRAIAKDWTGVDISKKQEIVYITRTGKVYHKTKKCKFLNLNIKKTTYGIVKQLRNSGGGKYYNCKSCNGKKLQPESVVYITEYGDSYHNNLECHSITREIIAIDISKVHDIKPCSNCGQGE